MYTALSPYDVLTPHRLERPLDELAPAPVVAQTRRPRLALIPWIVFLLITPPAIFVAHNWPATWVGFDVLLAAFMVTTAVLVFVRRQLVPLAALTTAVLLICDAWFDVMTAGPHDLLMSALTSTLVELPLAIILISTALRIFAADRDPVVAH